MQRNPRSPLSTVRSTWQKNRRLDFSSTEHPMSRPSVLLNQTYNCIPSLSWAIGPMRSMIGLLHGESQHTVSSPIPLSTCFSSEGRLASVGIGISVDSSSTVDCTLEAQSWVHWYLLFPREKPQETLVKSLRLNFLISCLERPVTTLVTPKTDWEKLEKRPREAIKTLGRYPSRWTHDAGPRKTAVNSGPN